MPARPRSRACRAGHALIGTAAQVVVLGPAERDDAFAAVVEAALPPVFAELGCGPVAFVAVSLAARPVDDGVRTGRDRRVGAAGAGTEGPGRRRPGRQPSRVPSAANRWVRAGSGARCTPVPRAGGRRPSTRATIGCSTPSRRVRP